MSDNHKRTALVTGGNRGIGLEVCRQLASGGYRVVLGARELARGEEAARSLASEGEVTARRVDVTDFVGSRRSRPSWSARPAAWTCW
jgi:NAD(P)-dependent dehydrogenase (short-subunit alcohol dehydrogenase family)